MNQKPFGAAVSATSKPSKHHEGFFQSASGASSIDSNPAEGDKTFKTSNTHLKENMMHWIFVLKLFVATKSAKLVKPIFKQAYESQLVF